MGSKKVTAIRVHYPNRKERINYDEPVLINNVDKYRFKLMEEYKAQYIYLEYEEITQ